MSRHRRVSRHRRPPDPDVVINTLAIWALLILLVLMFVFPWVWIPA